MKEGDVIVFTRVELRDDARLWSFGHTFCSRCPSCSMHAQRGAIEHTGSPALLCFCCSYNELSALRWSL